MCATSATGGPSLGAHTLNNGLNLFCRAPNSNQRGPIVGGLQKTFHDINWVIGDKGVRWWVKLSCTCTWNQKIDLYIGFEFNDLTLDVCLKKSANSWQRRSQHKMHQIGRQHQQAEVIIVAKNWTAGWLFFQYLPTEYNLFGCKCNHSRIMLQILSDSPPHFTTATTFTPTTKFEEFSCKANFILSCGRHWTGFLLTGFIGRIQFNNKIAI